VNDYRCRVRVARGVSWCLVVPRLPTIDALGMPATIGALLDHHSPLSGPGDERFEPVLFVRRRELTLLTAIEGRELRVAHACGAGGLEAFEDLGDGAAARFRSLTHLRAMLGAERIGVLGECRANRLRPERVRAAGAADDLFEEQRVVLRPEGRPRGEVFEQLVAREARVDA